MLRLFKFLFTGDWHLHEWEIIQKGEIVEYSGGPYVGTYYNTRCQHCGKIKVFNTD